MRILYAFLMAGVALLMIGCDQDLFHLSYRKIAGDYYLHRWEDDKTYYLEDRTRDKQDGGGAIGGVVVQLGWNDGFILVKRHSTFAGDPDGWMIVDVKKKTIQGPYTAEEIKSMPEADGLDVLDASKAWAKL